MNPKQRIQLHRMIKQECNTLRMVCWCCCVCVCVCISLVCKQQLTESRVALNNANREIARMKEMNEEREKHDKAAMAARQQKVAFSLASMVRLSVSLILSLFFCVCLILSL